MPVLKSRNGDEITYNIGNDGITMSSYKIYGLKTFIKLLYNFDDIISKEHSSMFIIIPVKNRGYEKREVVIFKDGEEHKYIKEVLNPTYFRGGLNVGDYKIDEKGNMTVIVDQDHFIRFFITNMINIIDKQYIIVEGVGIPDQDGFTMVGSKKKLVRTTKNSIWKQIEQVCKLERESMIPDDDDIDDLSLVKITMEEDEFNFLTERY